MNSSYANSRIVRTQFLRVVRTQSLMNSSPDLNLADYLVWTALQQMVQHHKISDTDQLKQVLIDSWTRRSQDTLNQAIDQLPKRMKMVIKGKSGNVEFCLDWPYVLEIALVLLYFEWKLNKTDASLSNPTQFWRHWRFMQIRQRISNCTDMQIMHFTLDKILKHLTYYTPFYHKSLQNYLISKTVWFFWPTLYPQWEIFVVLN